jgi:hypothetical protein
VGERRGQSGQGDDDGDQFKQHLFSVRLSSTSVPSATTLN